MREEGFINIFINKAKDYVNSWGRHNFTTLTENSRATPVLQIFAIFKLW